ncbi:hypothetical protein GCM10010840_13580 [Deinococcus aerolatus]|uniref:Holin-X, holin superfamily III n=1 Tax=Deinococcus aerolatus TaxID=522487 RepID=A0ABQ2G6D4_9DEIO|nr:hypothetical protein [Deinococcus aerolatus]GGL76819.1 hypothetical protein GCM10010840_13580 [Deinococcus aerolatus]
MPEAADLPRAGDPPAVPPDGPSVIERAVQQGLESERRSPAQGADLERLTRQLRYREAVDQRLLRLGVGAIVFILSAGWLAADVTLTLAAGWGELGGRPFRLDSSVLVAFLTTSTATVIGLFLVFLRWLYPQTNGGRGGEREPDVDRS